MLAERSMTKTTEAPTAGMPQKAVMAPAGNLSVSSARGTALWGIGEALGSTNAAGCTLVSVDDGGAGGVGGTGAVAAGVGAGDKSTLSVTRKGGAVDGAEYRSRSTKPTDIERVSMDGTLSEPCS